jgi:hypothetical protein
LQLLAEPEEAKLREGDAEASAEPEAQWEKDSERDRVGLELLVGQQLDLELWLALRLRVELRLGLQEVAPVVEALAPAVREAAGLTGTVLLPLSVLRALPEAVPAPVGLPVPLLLALEPTEMDALLLPVAAGDSEAQCVLSAEPLREALLL